MSASASSGLRGRPSWYRKLLPSKPCLSLNASVDRRWTRHRARAPVAFVVRTRRSVLVLLVAVIVHVFFIVVIFIVLSNFTATVALGILVRALRGRES
jgi:hypothetical protein